MIRNKTNLSQEAGNLRFYFLQERRNEIERERTATAPSSTTMVESE